MGNLQNLLKNFDEFGGGFGNAPKFRHEAQLLMLINEQMHHPSDDKLNAFTTTLDNMASGGIYDIVGSGFHRYATDNAWLFPHFEKLITQNSVEIRQNQHLKLPLILEYSK
jgi:uncharacterized protein YyaL (SSP411 family)